MAGGDNRKGGIEVKFELGVLRDGDGQFLPSGMEVIVHDPQAPGHSESPRPRDSIDGSMKERGPGVDQKCSTDLYLTIDVGTLVLALVPNVWCWGIRRARTRTRITYCTE